MLFRSLESAVCDMRVDVHARVRRMASRTAESGDDDIRSAGELRLKYMRCEPQDTIGAIQVQYKRPTQTGIIDVVMEWR